MMSSSRSVKPPTPARQSAASPVVATTTTTPTDNGHNGRNCAIRAAEAINGRSSMELKIGLLRRRPCSAMRGQARQAARKRPEGPSKKLMIAAKPLAAKRLRPPNSRKLAARLCVWFLHAVPPIFVSCTASAATILPRNEGCRYPSSPSAAWQQQHEARWLQQRLSTGSQSACSLGFSRLEQPNSLDGCSASYLSVGALPFGDRLNARPRCRAVLRRPPTQPRRMPTHRACALEFA